MVGGRRWSAEDFETLLVGHPLQRHLVRLLVLATYRDGAVSATFRLTEEGDYADSDDEPFALADHALVGIVHPMHLDSAQQAAWGEILADYEIVPPFPQLGRPVYDVEPGELDGGAHHALRRAPCPAGCAGPHPREPRMVAWRASGRRAVPPAQQVLPGCGLHGGRCSTRTASRPATSWKPKVRSSRICTCSREKGTTGTSATGSTGYGREHRSGGPMRWRDVDPVVRSEVLSDVHHLVAKAES